ncbi:chromosome segregation protein [Neobacillus piezotolerans]|uniref:Chromosome-anchoring protein RacA n=1 Tax=Neobacillus piezotolerans TaxID=2259171 RepID=A0A3D8GN81_9BACI|nr:MerR family transcriptional regulator [Neobacillus piezotolerans]RDU35741.1 chromosome segregation protein [Neobacillus piezotolerans]
MNSSEVAKLLGVSTSTVQRWVKQLNLPMERNERGHYTFNEEDIALLENIRDQIQKGALLQDVAPVAVKESRKGTVKVAEMHPDMEKVLLMFADLERRMDGKADSVAAYQLLQHRKEIEELQAQVAALAAAFENMAQPAAAKEQQSMPPLVLDSAIIGKRKKKRKIMGLFFDI